MSDMRTPPYDDAMEQAVIGAALQEPEALDAALELLKPSDFYNPRHEELWSLMARMVEAGTPVDARLLHSRLHDAGELARFENGAYLFTLIEKCPTAANVAQYAREVLDHAMNRRLVECGNRVVQLGYAGGSAAANLTAAQSQILGLDAPASNSGRWIGPIVEDVMEAAESGREAVATVPWGYGPEMPDLPCGRMAILAGRPGLGKSTAGLDAARHVAIRLGRPVAFFSLEMSQEEVGARTAAAQARIPLPHVQKGEMTPDDWARWARKVGAIIDAPLWVDDFPRADPGYIRSACRRLVRERGPLGLVVVDYLQLMEDNGAHPSKSRQQLVSEFSRSLTILAKELGTAPVLALAQLNRGPEARIDRRPQIHDLRESGSLEQDASQVILIHREDAYEKESPRAGEVDLIVAKNRGGPTTTAILAAQLHYSRFVSMSDRADPYEQGGQAA